MGRCPCQQKVEAQGRSTKKDSTELREGWLCAQPETRVEHSKHNHGECVALSGESRIQVCARDAFALNRRMDICEEGGKVQSERGFNGRAQAIFGVEVSRKERRSEQRKEGKTMGRRKESEGFARQERWCW